MISDGIMKSFHEARNAKMPTVALIGASSGKISCQNVCHVVAPSMRALSSSSSGIERRNAVNSSTLKLSWNMMCRMVTPDRVVEPGESGQLDLRQREHRERDEHRREQVEERPAEELAIPVAGDRERRDGREQDRADDGRRR